MKNFLLKYCFAAIITLAPLSAVYSATPYLTFSDLISGPDTGIGDGFGSGVIVTIWGQKLGNSQGDSKIYFTDSLGTQREAAHVYYWKNADGELPSGPANLNESHRMQEIAISIPDSADGAGTLQVEVNGQMSNTLPFTVRSGNIYHVTSGGSDSDNGSWASPWLTVEHAVDSAPAGSTTYIHNVDTGSNTTNRAIYWSNTSANSTLDAQFSIIAYPGYHPKVTGQAGIQGYRTTGMVVSKFDIYSSNYTSVDSNGQRVGSVIDGGMTFGILGTQNGRAIANRIGDIPGGCASKMQGAILGNAKFFDYVSNFKIFGNEIYEYGCNGSDKLHHTTYLTVRSDGDDTQVTPWEFGYNYLHDNKAKFGIHQYDQNEGCGDLTGPLHIHNNVITNQGGAGISVGSQCGWSMDVYIENNVLINVGLAADWDGLDPDTSDGPENGGIAVRDSGLLGTLYIRNNLIYKHTEDGQTRGGRGCLNLNGGGDNVSIIWTNNICYSEMDQPFVGTGFQAEAKLDNIQGSNNIWHYTGSSPSDAIVPSWDSAADTANPNVTVTGSTVSVATTSPAINNGTTTNIERDIYSNRRTAVIDIGPVEFLRAPPAAPTNFTVH